VLNPFLWAFVWSVVFAAMTYLFKDDAVVKYACLVLAAAPEVTALAIGVGFAIMDADRLQSEEYRLRQSAFQLLLDKAGDEKIVDALTQMVRIENLPGGVGDGDDK
jgi:hypothetical protein